MKRTPIQLHLAEMRGMSCFVCAPKEKNPHGLHLEFEETEDGAKADLHFHDLLQSYPGVVHGGVLSAVLDETMAYAIIFKAGRLPFTSRLELDYRLPVESESRYTVEAAVVSREGNRFKTEGRIKDAKGRSVVSAKAEFISPAAKMAKRLVPRAEWQGYEKYLEIEA